MKGMKDSVHHGHSRKDHEKSLHPPAPGKGPRHTPPMKASKPGKKGK